MEALFRVATIECSTYARTSKPSVKSQATSRLSACASVVRIAVELGVRKFRSKTMKAIVDHIRQTLPISNHGYCEPLVADYFKALRTLLEYPPHPEHLLREDWFEAVDFCNETLYNLNSASSGNPPKNSLSDSEKNNPWESFNRSVTPIDTRESNLEVGSRISRRAVQSVLKSSTKDLVLCMRHLIAASNAPVYDRAQEMLSNFFDLLASSSSPGPVQQVIFESINAIVTHVMTDDVNLTLKTVQKLLPHIRRFWEPKSSTVKDHMLISLLLGEVFFDRLISSDRTGNCKADLQRLLETFRLEYCKRPEREQLQLEDLELPDHPFGSEAPLSIKVFRVRAAALRAEQPWTLLYISASIAIVLSDDTRTRGQSLECDEDENSPKRQKLIKPLDEIFELTKSPETQEKLFALQVLGFVFDRMVVDVDSLQRYLEVMQLCLSDDQANIVSWGMLALTRY